MVTAFCIAAASFEGRRPAGGCWFVINVTSSQAQLASTRVTDQDFVLKALGGVMDADEIASRAIEHPNVVLVLQASPDLFHNSKTAATVD